jgi:hypothetical protein
VRIHAATILAARDAALRGAITNSQQKRANS